MLRRILFLLFVILLIVPSGALANDASWSDIEGKLLINVIPLQNAIKIGEFFSFEITMSNNSDDIQSSLRLLDIFFSYNDYTIIKRENTSGDYANFDDLHVGESITYTCKAKVPYNLDWYKNGNDYYTDILISVLYHQSYKLNDHEDFHEMIRLADPIPIKIDNLKDGSNFLSLSYQSISKDCIFLQYSDFDFNSFKGTTTNSVAITNVSNFEIEKLILTENSNYNSNIYLDSASTFKLEPNKSISIPVSNNHYISDNAIPEKVFDYQKVFFKINNNFYTDEIQKEVDFQLYYPPKLELVTEEVLDNNGETVLKITAINVSRNNYSNFYFDNYLEELSGFSEPVSIDKKNLISEFESNSKLELFIPLNSRKQLITGYIVDDYFFNWDIYLQLHKTTNASRWEISIYHVGDMDRLYTATPKPTPTPYPTAEETFYGSPNRDKNTTPAPLATNTPTPALPPTEPMIEVVDVKKSSSIPFWVWIVLGAAITGAGVVMFIIKKNRRTNND